MKIYFVRHGQTDNNYQRLIQGRVNSPLNKTGKKQAKETGQLLKSLNINFDNIVSSPLSRALETAHLIARKMSYKDSIIVEPLLIERDFGNFELMPIQTTFPKIMVPGFTALGYEDDLLIKARIQTALNNLYETHRGQTIIATVHAHVIRTAYIIMDSNKYNYTNFFLGNCSIHEFSYDGQNLILENTYNNEE